MLYYSVPMSRIRQGKMERGIKQRRSHTKGHVAERTECTHVKLPHTHSAPMICTLVEVTFSTILKSIKITFPSVIESVETILENVASARAQTVPAPYLSIWLHPVALY